MFSFLSYISIVIPLLTILIAVIALILQTRHSRIALQTDALLRCLEKFDGERMRAFRRMASCYLLKHSVTVERKSALEEVLEFFGDLAFLVGV